LCRALCGPQFATVVESLGDAVGGGGGEEDDEGEVGEDDE
jgi:hypothetical protein